MKINGRLTAEQFMKEATALWLKCLPMAGDTDAQMASIRAASIAKFQAATRGPFIARSASDHTDDWPHWLVADRNGINVIEYLAPELSGRLPFVSRIEAERLAGVANG